MAQRTYKRLTVARIKELARVPGMHPDGDGLYLAVTKAGVASWIYRYMLGRNERSMGLGPLRHVGLAEARRLADEARRLKRAGIDPIEHRRARQRDEALAVAKAVTFKQCAVAYIPSLRGCRHTEPASTCLPTEMMHFPASRNAVGTETPVVMTGVLILEQRCNNLALL
jgi:hypothetical protein